VNATKANEPAHSVHPSKMPPQILLPAMTRMVATGKKEPTAMAIKKAVTKKAVTKKMDADRQ
jgi:hypothetical protein